MLTNMIAYPVSIAMLAVSTVYVTLDSSFYLQQVHRWDRTSALLAATPGALSQIIKLANEPRAAAGNPGNIVVAFSPGAMDAMLALALTLHIDPIFVGAHHLSRFIFVSIASPGIIHLFGRPQVDADD